MDVFSTRFWCVLHFLSISFGVKVLNLVEQDLLAIPSIAELHEVWDFLSINSQHYAFGVSPSMMKTLAVNVDDAMDDMFRQIRGVSDDLQGALKTATIGLRYRLPLGNSSSGEMTMSQTVTTSGFPQTTTTSTTPGSLSNLKLSGPSQVLSVCDSGGSGEKNFATSLSEDEDHMALDYSGVHGFGSGDWQSDSDLHVDTHEADGSKPSSHRFGLQTLDDRDNLYFGRHFDRALSEGHSPVDSFISELVEDELVIPQEWSPPKVSVPLLNLVDAIFQLQGRGWIRRQVLWMAKQILKVGLGDAIDDWLLEKIQWLRSEEVVARGIQWVHRILWPDGIFLTKHPNRHGSSTNSGAPKEGVEMEGAKKAGQRVQQQAPVNSFEHHLEALRRAMVVREILLDRAPATLVNLIGKKQYTRCATDIYNFSQSTVCIKQLSYSLLEMLLLATFPELQDLLLDVHSGFS
jgi:sorting nexin-13